MTTDELLCQMGPCVVSRNDGLRFTEIISGRHEPWYIYDHLKKPSGHFYLLILLGVDSSARMKAKDSAGARRCIFLWRGGHRAMYERIYQDSLGGADKWCMPTMRVLHE